GLAKPDVAIYEEVLGKIKVPAKNVLFFDDLTANLEGAEKVGIQTHQITHPMGLMEFFDLY
ncbi:HAD-IA family hydrolase, partial [Cecembia rubra]